MNLILRNTDRIEMSMAEFIDFTKSVVKEAVAETYGEYMSRNEAIRYLGSRNKLEKAIKMKLICPDKGNGNQKWRVKTREVIEAYKIIDKLWNFFNISLSSCPWNIRMQYLRRAVP